MVKLRSRQGHGNVKGQVKTRSGQVHGMTMQVQGKVKAGFRQGKASSRRGQGKVERQGQQQ